VESGCTVHLVTDEVDGGPIIIQKKCPVLTNDSPETLKSRVQGLEGVAFIEAIQLFQAKRTFSSDILNPVAALTYKVCLCQNMFMYEHESRKSRYRQL
jgi:folate-dependent phosphoribosylglycinamide formyltransferase PurN